MIRSLPELPEIPLFDGLSEEERQQFLSIASIEEFAAGDYILQQGDLTSNLWIILSGQCEVVKRMPEHAGRRDGLVLDVLSPHHVCGEMSFFHAAPHCASVRAKTATRMLKISKEACDHLTTSGCPAPYKIAINVVRTLSDRLRNMDERVVELVSHPARASRPEWQQFRDKLFGAINQGGSM